MSNPSKKGKPPFDPKKIFDEFFSTENKLPPMKKEELYSKLNKMRKTKQFKAGKMYCGAGCGRILSEKNISNIFEAKGRYFLACTDPRCFNQIDGLVTTMKRARPVR